MKKRVAVLLASICLLFGCYSLNADKLFTKEAESARSHTAEVKNRKEDSASEPGQFSVVEKNTEEEQKQDTEEIQIFSADEIARLKAEQEQLNLYCYRHISEEERDVYVEILRSLTNMREARLSSTDPEQIDKVFQCVLNDYPELFYVEGYAFTKYTRGDIITKIHFKGSFTSDRQEIEERQQRIDAYAEQCLSGVPEQADDYLKIKYVYEYIIKNTEYNVNAPDNQNICSVFLNNESVCQGYAKATQYLLQKLGIEAALVIGQVEGGEGHAWNLVKSDGSYYYVDTTWGDASYRTDAGGEQLENLPVINYDYLCVTTDQLSKTHRIDNVVPMPRCVSLEDNFYVREGAYFTDINEEQLAQVFEKSYSYGEDYVTLQCADEAVYRDMVNYLITDQKIFRYLNEPDGIVAYSDNEKQLSLGFWLSE